MVSCITYDLLTLVLKFWGEFEASLRRVTSFRNLKVDQASDLPQQLRALSAPSGDRLPKLLSILLKEINTSQDEDQDVDEHLKDPYERSAASQAAVSAVNFSVQLFLTSRYIHESFSDRCAVLTIGHGSYLGLLTSSPADSHQWKMSYHRDLSGLCVN